MSGVELAASENGVPSQLTAQEENGQYKLVYRDPPRPCMKMIILRSI